MNWFINKKKTTDLDKSSLRAKVNFIEGGLVVYYANCITKKNIPQWIFLQAAARLKANIFFVNSDSLWIFHKYHVKLTIF